MAAAWRVDDAEAGAFGDEPTAPDGEAAYSGAQKTVSILVTVSFVVIASIAAAFGGSLSVLATAEHSQLYDGGSTTQTATAYDAQLAVDAATGRAAVSFVWSNLNGSVTRHETLDVSQAGDCGYAGLPDGFDVIGKYRDVVPLLVSFAVLEGILVLVLLVVEIDVCVTLGRCGLLIVRSVSLVSWLAGLCLLWVPGSASGAVMLELYQGMAAPPFTSCARRFDWVDAGFESSLRVDGVFMCAVSGIVLALAGTTVFVCGYVVKPLCALAAARGSGADDDTSSASPVELPQVGAFDSPMSPQPASERPPRHPQFQASLPGQPDRAALGVAAGPPARRISAAASIGTTPLTSQRSSIDDAHRCPICFRSWPALVPLQHANPSGDVSQHAVCARCHPKMVERGVCPICRGTLVA